MRHVTLTRRHAVVLMLLGLWSTLAVAGFPSDSIPPLEKARSLAAEKDWGGAIDAYAEHLGKLTTRDYRDKKVFDWILDEYEKAAADGAPDYDAFANLLTERLPKAKAKPDPIFTWRIHLLLARIAERRDDHEAQRTSLEAAIAAYPEVNYGEPDRQSRLQHVYNTVALLQAKEDPAAAEKYLLDSFAKDPRFLYVYLPPWKEFYEKAETPEKFADFAKRVVEAYDAKAKALPEQADLLIHYRNTLGEELAATP